MNQLNKQLDTLIYIAGPMTGKPELNFPEFNRVAKLLRDNGFNPVNPAEFDSDGMLYSDILARDINALSKCSTILMLNGWMTSKGARTEHIFASNTGKRIVYLKDQVELTPNRNILFASHIDKFSANNEGLTGNFVEVASACDIEYDSTARSFIGLISGKKIVGYLSYTAYPESSEACIKDFAILREYRDKGGATLLMQLFISRMKNLSIKYFESYTDMYSADRDNSAAKIVQRFANTLTPCIRAEYLTEDVIKRLKNYDKRSVK